MSDREWLNWDYIEQTASLDRLDRLIYTHMRSLADLVYTIKRLKKIRKAKNASTPNHSRSSLDTGAEQQTCSMGRETNQ